MPRLTEPEGNERTSEQSFAEAQRERQKHIDTILGSPSRKKIVVAGPGTGKTYLFKEILKGKTRALTLTFVNSLVEDLALELCGLSVVSTLHSFARGELSTPARKIKLFPKLPSVVREDAKMLLNQEVQFEELFHNRDDENVHLNFYEQRKRYYGYYGYSDIIFALVKHFETNPSEIPTYEQVVVDEFQDFNKLEVSLIDMLALKSPILLAGDDDQALYAFKSASPEHIRQRYGSSTEDFTSFTLPYCSRCTKVIVEAVNDLIASATRRGHLKRRISKPYRYFHDKEKDKESNRNPKILHAQIFDAQIPWLIQTAINDIAEEVKSRFSVLIISPFKRQAQTIAAALRKKGLANVECVETKEQAAPSFLDGLKILLDDDRNNLGWRIVSSFLLEPDEFASALKQTSAEGAKNIADILDSRHVEEIDETLKLMRAIQEGKEIDRDKLARLLSRMKIEPYALGTVWLQESLNPSQGRLGNPGIRKIPIRATTIQSSKGLSAEYVFITHFDDRYLVKDTNQISDQEICNFLVALTRAKKRVFLISSDQRKKPTFLQWINEQRVEAWRRVLAPTPGP